jgi:hypothetical protein
MVTESVAVTVVVPNLAEAVAVLVSETAFISARVMVWVPVQVTVSPGSSEVGVAGQVTVALSSEISNRPSPAVPWTVTLPVFLMT